MPVTGSASSPDKYRAIKTNNAAKQIPAIVETFTDFNFPALKN